MIIAKRYREVQNDRYYHLIGQKAEKNCRRSHAVKYYHLISARRLGRTAKEYVVPQAQGGQQNDSLLEFAH